MSAYSDAVAALTPIAYWRLGESSGTSALDDSGNGNHATYVGSPTLAQGGLLTGDADTAVDFNGSGQYTTSSVWTTPPADLSIALWFRLGSTGRRHELISNEAGSPAGVSLSVKSSSVLEFGVFNGGYSVITGGTALSAGVTYFVVAIRDNSAGLYRLYLDAVSEGTASSGGAPASASVGLRIARNPQSSSFDADAIIDEVSLFGSVLSPTEISDLYTAGTTGGGGAFTLTADSGSVTITGTAASLLVGHSLSADSAAFVVTGTAATLKVGRRLSAESGSVAITGGDATLTKTGSLTLSADAGAVAITGTAASLTVGRKLVAAGGSVTLTGAAASLLVGRVLGAGSGTVSLVGSAATLLAARRLSAASGSFSITGGDATLTYDDGVTPVAPLLSDALFAGLGETRDGTTYDDSSPNDRNGTITGAAWQLDATINRYVLSLNGTSDYAAVPWDLADLPLGAYSIAAWVYPRSLPDHGDNSDAGHFVTFAESPGDGVADRSIGFDEATDRAVAYHYDGAAKFAYGPVLTLNQWQHVVNVYDGTNLRCYVDGVSGTPVAAGAPYAGYATPELVVGRDFNDRADMLIADVLVYGSALTAGNVAWLADPENTLLVTAPTAIDIGWTSLRSRPEWTARRGLPHYTAARTRPEWTAR